MFRFLLVLFVSLWAVMTLSPSAEADVTVDGKSVGESPAEDAKAGLIAVRRADCRVLMRHRPDADVAHKPGAGVDGRTVAPADITPPLDLTERANSFAFAVTVDLEDRLGTGGEGQARPFDGEGFVGYVEMRDGVPHWNGKPLDRDGIEAVSAACRNSVTFD